MNDHLRPASPPPDADGELLSAYLSGELDDAATARLEERLAAEPPLAAALEGQRVVRELLAATAPVQPPAGYGDRLRQRLAEERRAGGPAAATAHPEAVTTDELAAARARRGRALRWGKVSGIAAAFVAVALIGGNVLSGLGGDDTTADVAMEATDGEAREFLDGTDAGLEMDDDTIDTDTADEQELATLEAEADDASDDGAVDDTDDAPAAGDHRAAAAQPSEPVIGSEDGAPVNLPDDAAVGEHLRGRPEAEGVLGISGTEARDLAAAFEVAVRRAAPFPDGTSPSACLDTAIDGTAGPAVPVRVEPAIYDDTASLAYLVVTSSGDGGTLDRIEAWVIESRLCTTRLFLNLSQP
jgi:hypothetical protein